MTTPRVKIVSGGMGHSSQVFVRKGEEWVEISSCVTAASVNLDVNDANRATLSVILVGTEIEADLHDLVYKFAGRSRWGRVTWPLRNWWWRRKVKPREVTTVVDTARRYVS